MFEWDPRKAEANAAKHGVSFDDAVTIFLDANALDGQDLQHSSAETRFRRLGRSADGRVLMVAYTLRRSGDAETIRLINFSDIPDSSPEQLKTMRRVGRPSIGEKPRQLIAIRVDQDVLDQFRKEARRRRVGYQTLINEVLAHHISKGVA